MNRFFSIVNEHCDNLYVADYTLHSHAMRKVQISETIFTDIDFFSINNPKKSQFYSVNFEENKLKDSNNNLIPQCECLCASKDTDGWVCFIELKYCKPHNIRSNSHHAYSQLTSTYMHLKNKGILNGRKNIYLVFSVPEYKRAPFENFLFSQHKILEIKRKEGYIVKGINSIKIVNKNVII